MTFCRPVVIYPGGRVMQGITQILMSITTM